MTCPDIRLAGIFIQTDRGVIVFPVIMDFRRRAHRKSHAAAAGRPEFWIKWYPCKDALRRLAHECSSDPATMADCMKCRLIHAHFTANVE